MNIYRHLIFLSLYLSFTHLSYAETRLSISPGIMYFNYEEFDTSGVTLDTEIGFLPGVSATLENDLMSAGAHIFTGDVTYDGQTQSGIPHKTDTDESLYYLFYRFNIPSNVNHRNFFIGVNYQLWERFIKASNGVGSLYEEYTWWSLEAGITVDKFLSGNSNVNLEVAGFRTFNGEILIDLENAGFGEPVLNLGDKFGLRSQLSLELESGTSSVTSIGLEYTYWGFGRSNTAILSDGINTISIVEPESKSNLLRFFIQITHAF